MFSYGADSASHSFLGENFYGELYKKGIKINSPSFQKVLVELGFVGVLLYLFFIFSIIIQGIIKKNYLLFGAGFVFLVTGFYTSSWHADATAFLFWFVLCYDLTLNKRENK